MIDFKYTVVNLLILIGFAIFTCGSLVLVNFFIQIRTDGKQNQTNRVVQI